MTYNSLKKVKCLLLKLFFQMLSVNFAFKCHLLKKSNTFVQRKPSTIFQFNTYPFNLHRSIFILLLSIVTNNKNNYILKYYWLITWFVGGTCWFITTLVGGTCCTKTLVGWGCCITVVFVTTVSPLLQQ